MSETKPMAETRDIRDALAEARPTHAISIRQPWAWLILHAGKDIENRSWATTRRGRVLIHAAKGMTRDEYDDAAFHSGAIISGGRRIALPPFAGLPRGGIVGSVEIVGCVTYSNSLWFSGPHGFVLRDPRPLPFQPLKGELGFFRVAALPSVNLKIVPVEG
jgi:hypothetical protein